MMKGWYIGVVAAVGLLGLAAPARAGHCTLSAAAGGPDVTVTTLSQLTSRPNNELQCNSFNFRSGVDPNTHGPGGPANAPGFNPFRLLAFEQQLTSQVIFAGDRVTCRPVDTSKLNVGDPDKDSTALANCTDRMILSSLQPGQITGNPFGMLVSFPAQTNQTAGIQPDDVGTQLFSNEQGEFIQPLQSMIVPDGPGAFDSGTTNNAGTFAVNPITHVGVLLSVVNDSLLPGRLGSLRTVQVTTAGLKSFGMAFGNDFAFNPNSGSLSRPGRGAAVAGSSAYVELASAFCPSNPTQATATVCSRLTVVEEIEGAVGDEAITGGTGPTAEMFFTLQSFHASITQSDGLNTFGNPVVYWRQRVDDGLFVLDTLGSFAYNSSAMNPILVPNTTYVTGQTISSVVIGPLPGGLSSFANLVSVENGVCFPGGFAADRNTNCPGPPQAPAFP